jgi:hypothetical protein
MRALVIDGQGESREYLTLTNYAVRGPSILLIDVAGLHIYPAATTTIHFSPETDADMDYLQHMVNGTVGA